MICEKCLRYELDRCPKWIKEAKKADDWVELADSIKYKEFLEWVLSEDICEKVDRD